jgi:hypothetical protein
MSDSATEFGHHLFVGDAPLPRCRLSLGNSELSKQLNLCLQAFIMVDTHYNQVAFTVGCQIHGLILIVADARNLPSPIAQT